MTLESDSHIESFRHQQIPLLLSIADSPRMAAWYVQYNDQDTQAYVKSVEIRKEIERSERNYVGADACKGCHQNACNVWSSSQHARVFDSLAMVNKVFGPNCIICHTAGFNKDGGYILIIKTLHAHLTVQYESCHGAAREYVTANGKIATEQRKWPMSRMCV